VNRSQMVQNWILWRKLVRARIRVYENRRKFRRAEWLSASVKVKVNCTTWRQVGEWWY